MERQDVLEKILAYFTENFQDKIDTSKVPLNGGAMAYLGVDSLRSLEVLIDMESLFGIEITDDILSFKLVDDIEHMTDTILKLQCKV